MTLVASDMRRPGEPLTAGARPIRSVPSRPSSTRSSKAAPGEGGNFGRWLLASRLYSLTLGYGTPKSFFAVAPDTWPGDPSTGQRLLLGELLARGSSGAVANRLADVTARPRTWPARTAVNKVPVVLNMQSTCPAIRSVNAGAPPR